MNKTSPLSTGARTAVSLLCALGLIGACLVVGMDGFTSASKRGEFMTFVPAPLAYFAAAPLLAMSITALFVLLRDSGAGARRYVLWFGLYALAAVSFALFARGSA